MKLYYIKGSCALFSHIILCESEFEFEIEAVDPIKKITETGIDYFSINPKGQVPALHLDNGEILTETVAIALYLGDKDKSTHLLPFVGNLERYRVIEWLNFIGTELHKNFGPLFHDASEEDKQATRHTLYQKFDWVNKNLAKHNFLVKSGYSLADSYLYVVTFWAIRLDLDLTPYPALLKHFNLVAHREAVKQARKNEGLKEEFFV